MRPTQARYPLPTPKSPTPLYPLYSPPFFPPLPLHTPYPHLLPLQQYRLRYLLLSLILVL